MTEELSFASGYAELYERFCNHSPSELEKNNFEKITQYRLKEKGYKVDPKEITLSIDDIIKKDYISSMFDVNPLIDKDKLKQYLLRLTDNDPIGIPYTNILTNGIEYLNFRLLYAIKVLLRWCLTCDEYISIVKEVREDGFEDMIAA